MRLLALHLHAALAAAASSLHVVLEPPLCCGWEEQSFPPEPLQAVRFVVRTRESAIGLAKLRRVALEVSDPASAKYGQYLLQSQIDALVAPNSEDVTVVEQWLSSAKSSCLTVRVLKPHIFEMECEQAGAERLFRTSLRQLRNPLTGQSVANRASDYWVPDEVSAVFGLHDLPIPTIAAATSSSTSSSSSSSFLAAAVDTTSAPKASPVSPAAILDAYNFTGQVQA